MFECSCTMEKFSFTAVCNTTRSHPVFNRVGKRKLYKVEVQLMVVLKRLGNNFGTTGSSIGRISRECGISEGSVNVFTKRVFTAIFSLEKRFVYWLTAVEKKGIAKKIQERSGFPDCIGCVDGSLIPVMYKPSFNGGDFYNRKNCYGLNILAVCDHLRRFRFAHLGFSRCAHDTRVYRCSPLAENLGKYFQGGEEYVLDDSGYPFHPTVMTPFKKPIGEELTAVMSNYNYMHAKGRVPIENAFGILKEVLQSLTCLRHVKQEREASSTLQFGSVFV